MPGSRLFLIDSFGYIFRAYHARARSGAPPMRTSKGLSTEVAYIFHNMVRKLQLDHQPAYLAAVFESAGPTFRDEAYAEYKANRAEMPPDLSEQIPWVRRILEALKIPVLEYPRFEADDVIGTIARQASEAGVEVVIVSSDKDLMQLVTDRVSMLNPVKEDTCYDAGAVAAFMGVPPGQVADLLALKGDAIDNIPGAPGIGEKGARDLIVRFGSVEQVLEHAAEVERKTYRESLLNHRDQILLSKRLASIDTSVPIEWSLEALASQSPDLEHLRAVYRELEFLSLLRDVEPASVPGGDYRVIERGDELLKWLDLVPPGAPLAVAFGQEGEGLLSAPALGFAARAGEGRGVLFDLIPTLKALMEDPARPKLAHDVKALLLGLRPYGVSPAGFQRDVMLEGFLLTADPAASSLGVLAERFLGKPAGKSVEEQAACVVALAARLAPEIEARQLRDPYEQIEMPLIPVLAAMTEAGIRVVPARLEELSSEMETGLMRLAAGIHELAGHPFNINSPQQLAKVLFDELKLPVPVRYGRGKTVSTAADVLEDLAADHPIAQQVLDYRQLAKLKNTYIDALPGLIHPETGRLHTTFNQAGSATGRISSSNPNLQNIPIRTETGREIRAAFVPEPGWRLVVADYSQIELRLLAHMSGDPVLVDAFRRGEDIHTRTAAEVFGVPRESVSAEMRRRAKAVNFGIVYGLSAFGLAGQLGIPRAEADTYIRKYFERYAGVRAFIDATIAGVKKTGEVRTLFGRLRPIPDMHSRNPAARGFAERTAVNTPLQGTAADLIKLAMIRIDRRLREQNRRTRMLLQVHDELLFESPPEEVEPVSAMVRSEMETVREFDVPLVAELGVGENWRDAK